MWARCTNDRLQDIWKTYHLNDIFNIGAPLCTTRCFWTKCLQARETCALVESSTSSRLLPTCREQRSAACPFWRRLWSHNVSRELKRSQLKPCRIFQTLGDSETHPAMGHEAESKVCIKKLSCYHHGQLQRIDVPGLQAVHLKFSPRQIWRQSCSIWKSCTGEWYYNQ